VLARHVTAPEHTGGRRLAGHAPGAVLQDLDAAGDRAAAGTVARAHAGELQLLAAQLHELRRGDAVRARGGLGVAADLAVLADRGPAQHRPVAPAVLALLDRREVTLVRGAAGAATRPYDEGGDPSECPDDALVHRCIIIVPDVRAGR